MTMAELTSIHRNPFLVLGATTRDDRRQIVDLADARSLEIEDSLCQKARADLTNPRSRISAEVGWLPGISPARAEKLCHLVALLPLSVLEEQGLPSLTKANLLAATLESLTGGENRDSITRIVEELAEVMDSLDPVSILRDINEDRLVSGFPEVSASMLESALEVQKRLYKTAVKRAFERLPSEAIVQIMTSLVEDATLGGDLQSAQLIDDLVDSYELEASHFLEAEGNNVRRLLDLVRDIAPQGESALEPIVERLERVIHNWDRIAQPIQLSAKARGLTHEPSRTLAFEVRGLAVDLWNDHRMLDTARRITGTLGEVFAELPEFDEKIQDDFEALSRFARERDAAAEEEEDTEEDTPFEARVGLLRDVFRISSEGISWKNRFYPMSQITRVRWGGTRKSVNGIPTGTTYTIAFGNANEDAVIETGSQAMYSAFVDRIWPNACTRLLVEMLRRAQDGSVQTIGEATITDEAIHLRRQKVFGRRETIAVPWNALNVRSEDGTAVLSSKVDSRINAQLSYLYTWNAHLLEFAAQLAAKKGVSRLSELLGG